MQSYIKRRLSYIIFLFPLTTYVLKAQGNCDLMVEGSKERIACEYGRKAITFKQGSKQSQLLFDSAIAVNPDYAWAYYEKSVPFFKRGMLSEGVRLLNKAVALDPLSYLTYRAYWFSQHKSYERCRDDLEQYYAMEGAYAKNTPDGALDLKILLGIVYSELDLKQQAINQVEETISSYPSEAYLGPYDYHTLGVLYLKHEQYDQAKVALQKSLAYNEQFADTYYYLSLTEQSLGEINKAKDYILECLKRFDGKENGYSGYPLCFPVSRELAERQIEILKGLG
ncbi:hypothetical protein BFP97_01125 [Roseivirga sp. 4D4]|uniref:tetratricopeptide repeat protein n=1 Tax=Roseivirga sp. 4D4 TaxID=1889784 RepID=UPI00085328BD|nr:hypothetical protein [Roseivirga sp. 4D4]OEK00197.1 hypothetical protein BFP97_01125 [Roseivirga sp. 4D4]